MKITAEEMAAINSASIPPRPNLWKMLMVRLFPYHSCPDPTFEGATEMIVTKARVTFSFWGRVMILLGAAVEVETRIAAEHPTGKTVSKSITRIGPESLP